MSSVLRGLALSAGLLVVLLPLSARAEDTPLAEARVEIEEQRYEEALAHVLPLTAASTPAPMRARALEIAAVAHLLLGNEAQAAPLVRDLYDLAPAFLLTDRSLPPRVTNAFDAEAARPHVRKVAMSARSVSSDVGDYELQLSGPVAKVDVACRSGSDGAFTAVTTQPLTGGARAFRLPTLGTYRCFAVALDQDDLAIGRLGTSSRPVELHAQDKPKGGLLSRWWFWTGVGAALAAGAAITWAVTRPETAQPPPADITVRPAALVRF